MADRTDMAGLMKGHDAMHRARIPETHPTHACSEQFRAFSGISPASPVMAKTRSPAILAFFAMLASIAGRSVP